MEEKPGSQTQFDQSSTTPGTDQSSTSINHFSHPHPLQGLNINSCAACKLEVSGMAYGCTMCNYILHQKCYQLPQQITHPFEQSNHILSLHPEQAYPEVIFYCDACGKPGDGFSYRCQSCVINLHTRCASMPMVYTHPSHQHPLRLTFSPPYPNRVFSCDICKMTGHNNWLYRCSVCEFDVHLTCINASPPKQNHSIYQPSSRPLIQIPYMTTSAYSSPPASMTMNSGAYGRQASAIMSQILNGVSNGISNGASQSVSQSLLGMLGSCGGMSNQSIGNSSQPNGGFGIMGSGAGLAGLSGVGGDSGRDNGGLQDLFQGLSLSDNGSGAIPGMEYFGSDGDGQNTGAGGMNILQGLMGSGSDSASRNGLHPLGGYGGLSILNGLDMGGIVGGLLGAFTRRITRRIIRRISRRITRRITRRRTRRITRRIIRRIGRRIARRITWNI